MLALSVIFLLTHFAFQAESVRVGARGAEFKRSQNTRVLINNHLATETGRVGR